MSNDSATLARSITRASSKQSYMTARLLVDKDLMDDCCRAYGYFRWVDDVVDAPLPVDAPATAEAPAAVAVPTPIDPPIQAATPPRPEDERVTFIRRQRELIDRLYRNERPRDLAPEEEIIADLISNDRGEDSGLRSFIENFLAITEFDAHRRGKLISQNELAWYSSCLGKAVTDAIQYFIGNGHSYPDAGNRYLAATSAHITHMLRDYTEDRGEGYFNIPREYLKAHGISTQDVQSPAFRNWVRQRVAQSRHHFREGKRYIDTLDVLRCKIAAHWYCARFEGVLSIIERDDFVLRATYSERSKLSTWLRMAWLAVSVTIRHIVRWGRRVSGYGHP